MRKGFIFNSEKCVNCGACRAACSLANNWNIQPRVVYTYNSDAIPSFPLYNLSLACNHCETAVCLEGCPASAFVREPLTGAVIVDDKKCIGCKYCMWNCPYEAPKFDRTKGVIGKCNLCYSLVLEGDSPACAIACPTGALKFGEIAEETEHTMFSWFPQIDINPAIKFIGKEHNEPLMIIPERMSDPPIPKEHDNAIIMEGIWSLITFSFLAMISVSTLITSLINGKFPSITLFFSTIILAGIVSLFHLGKPLRAWRSIINLRGSPISREVSLFILYSVSSLASIIFELPVILIGSAISGLVLLIMIDTVYIYSDKRMYLMMQGGQTFLTCLLIVSFFTGFIWPFLFIAAIKIAYSVNSLIVNKLTNRHFGLRFLRIALLIIPGFCLISRIAYPDAVISIVFLAGELIDRILFYIDFNPLQISTEIRKHLNIEVYETKRG